MPAYDDTTLRGHLEGLGIGMPIIQRIENLIEECKAFMGTPPEFVFVENPNSNSGIVEVSNLILVYGKMYAEFSVNNPNDTVAFLNIDKNVNRIIMPLLQEYPFTNITARSRLTVRIFNGLEEIGFFVASGNNCADLLDMTKRYFIPAVGE